MDLVKQVGLAYALRPDDEVVFARVDRQPAQLALAAIERLPLAIRDGRVIKRDRHAIDLRDLAAHGLREGEGRSRRTQDAIHRRFVENHEPPRSAQLRDQLGSGEFRKHDRNPGRPLIHTVKLGQNGSRGTSRRKSQQAPLNVEGDFGA